MRALYKLTWIELKLFLREPIAVFFTLAFPLLLLFVFGSIYGNQPAPELGGYGTVDVSVPGYIAMLIGTVGLIGLPITLASYRERGVLRRFRTTPISPMLVLGAELLAHLVTLVVGSLLLVLVARLTYDLRLPRLPLAVIVAGVWSALSFCAISFALAGLLPRARTAQAVGMALLYPMLFLSGAAMPRAILPPTLRRIGEFLPLTHVVTLLEELWFGQGWNLVSLAVLAGVLLGGALLTLISFRWE